MDTNQINTVLRNELKNFPSCNFLGVYAANEIPLNSNAYPYCFIANTDPSNKPGSHWVAVFFSCPFSFEFFDSFALPLSTYRELLHLNRIASCSYSCTHSIQSIDSNFCGQYSMYFILSRASGKIFNDILASFSSSSPHLNEKFIREFSAALNLCPCKNSSLHSNTQFCKCQKECVFY